MSSDEASTLGQTPVERTIAGKYQLLRLLGQGGMGAVYEARHLSTLKRCAVKLLLSPELAGHAGMVKRFVIEAKASSVIESEHVVDVFDSGTDPESNLPFMVMELLRGEDLEQVVKRLGPLDPGVVTKIALQAATGLSKAHALGIVHRDIKAANLFLSERDSGELVVKVLDFGIAKVKMEQFHESSHGLTRTGSLLGTPLYMSPEQAQGAPGIDARTDVWSLGAVMFELLCGETPFALSRSLGELMVNIITGQVPPIQARAPWVSPELAAIVHRAMARDPAARFSDAGALQSALAALVDGSRLDATTLAAVPDDVRARPAPRLELSGDIAPSATSPATSVTRPGTSDGRSAGRGIALGAGALLLGAAALAAVVFAARGERTPIVADATPSVRPSAAAQERTGVLEVAPPGVVVTIDGRVAEVSDGGVRLTGPVGAVSTVRLSLGAVAVEERVAVTATGLLPGRVELELPPATQPARPVAPPVAKSRPDTKPTVAPPPAIVSTAPPAAPAPATAKPPQVSDDMKEFGN